VTFLAPLHQTPSRRIALLFAARARDSKVSLLAGSGSYLLLYIFASGFQNICLGFLDSKIAELSGESRHSNQGFQKREKILFVSCQAVIVEKFSLGGHACFDNNFVVFRNHIYLIRYFISRQGI